MTVAGIVESLLSERVVGSELYHTTGRQGLAGILKRERIDAGGKYKPYFVSMSSRPVFAPSGQSAVIVLDASSFRNDGDWVEYTEDWFYDHPDEVEYITGTCRPSSKSPPQSRCFREFMGLEDEKEWISDPNTDLIFDPEDVRRIILSGNSKKNIESVKEFLAKKGVDSVYLDKIVPASGSLFK